MEAFVLVRGYQFMWRPLQCAEDIGESIHSERTYMACLYPRIAVQIQMRHTSLTVLPGKCNHEGQKLQRDIYEVTTTTRT